MIEVILDFNEVYNINDCNGFEDEYRIVMCKLFTYIYKKLNINNMIAVNWNAFSDNFAELFFKLPPDDYEYKESDEWCWKNKKEYEGYVQYYNRIGLKNKEGKRDDMKLIFINFYPFFKKYRSISNDLLEIILDYINLSSKEEEDECLKLHWHKMVLEIRS